eukprot:6291929-Amphidinium_carterae.1
MTTVGMCGGCGISCSSLWSKQTGNTSRMLAACFRAKTLVLSLSFSVMQGLSAKAREKVLKASCTHNSPAPKRGRKC